MINFNKLDLSTLDSINKIENDLSYPDEVYDYLNKLGKVLHGKESNRNDWDYIRFTFATKEERIKALEMTFSKNKSNFQKIK